VRERPVEVEDDGSDRQGRGALSSASGVIVATALAGIFLKERVGWVRMAGAVVVAAGIGLLSLG